MAETKAAKAGQEKDSVAADVAGTASAVTQGSEPVAPNVKTETAEVAIRETAGPLGSTYAVGPDGQPFAIHGDGGDGDTAVVTVTTPDPAVSPLDKGHIVDVKEVVTETTQFPVVANPGPPEHLKPVPEVTVKVQAQATTAPVEPPTWTEAKPDPGEES